MGEYCRSGGAGHFWMDYLKFPKRELALECVPEADGKEH